MEDSNKTVGFTKFYFGVRQTGERKTVTTNITNLPETGGYSAVSRFSANGHS